MPQSRWLTDTSPGHSQWYIERFRKMAAEGHDLVGEARFVDALVPRDARVLDAGCGPGRHGAELHRRGHTVVGVDVDPELIAAAEQDHPGPAWLVGDLAELDLPAAGHPDPFDAILVAGNVMTFLAPGTQVEVLHRLGAHLAPQGRIAVGFGFGRGYSLDSFDDDVHRAGLGLQARFGTWDIRPFTDDSNFAVSLLAHP